MSNYLGVKELEQVASICNVLNSLNFSEISVGTVEVYDLNGDTLGYVSMTENAEYGFFMENPDKE